MTQRLGPDNPHEEIQDLAAYHESLRVQSLDERMTMLELTIGVALYEQAHQKISRSALQRVASYVTARCGIPEAQRLSTISYGQFYNSVGIPMEVRSGLPDSSGEDFRKIYNGYSGLV